MIIINKIPHFDCQVNSVSMSFKLVNNQINSLIFKSRFQAKQKSFLTFEKGSLFTFYKSSKSIYLFAYDTFYKFNFNKQRVYQLSELSISQLPGVHLTMIDYKLLLVKIDTREYTVNRKLVFKV